MRKWVLIQPLAYDKVSDKQSQEVYANSQRVLAGIFGGYSSYSVYQGNGGWVDDQGDLCREPHYRFECYDDSRGEAYSARKNVMRHLAQSIAIALDQDCVLLSEEPVGSVNFITQEG